MSTNDPAARLFPALYEGDEDAVVRLLRAGVSAEAVDEDGQSALYLAAVSDQPGMVRLLLAAGADPDRLSLGTDAPLCGAACGGHTEVVHALLAAGAGPNTVEEFGLTALTWALRGGHTAVAKALLDAGADPDRPGPAGEPPLVTAAHRGSVGCVRALLAHGAGARAEALAEARRLLGVDLEAELLAGLTRTHGPGHPSVTHRHPSPEGITVEVQFLDAEGRPFAGDDLQTGHAEIAALLEAGAARPGR
ncbi:ankyrin repeat domain-containing protein [Streptomyces sp. NPDC060027]|uniref:ankyrin repeat domain-containing protein n=1 Tax=Streptomyces sp. NPDC060027 TaxID=3347040 RepID=UPI0036A12DE9